MDKAKRLTDKQEKFVQNLLLGQSQREAYKNSYSANNMQDNTIDKKAYEIFKKDYVRGRFDVLKDKVNKKAEEKFELNATEILKSIIEVRERCMQKKPVMRFDKESKTYVQATEEDENGVEQGIWTFDSSSALKANELLGKNIKMWTDKVETVNTNHNLNQDVTVLTEEELDKIIADAKK